MWKKYSGFTFVELIAAITIWVVLTSLVLPSFIQISLERKNETLKSTANQIMNEELLLNNGSKTEGKQVTRNGYAYSVYWQSVEGGNLKVCIRWHDHVGRLTERCGYTKNDTKQ